MPLLTGSQYLRPSYYGSGMEGQWCTGSFGSSARTTEKMTRLPGSAQTLQSWSAFKASKDATARQRMYSSDRELHRDQMYRCRAEVLEVNATGGTWRAGTLELIEEL